MTHERPIPPDNRSPYPIAEPPHEHSAPLPPVAEPAQGSSRLLTIGGAIAVVGLAAGGIATFLLRRGKPGRRKACIGPFRGLV